MYGFGILLYEVLSGRSAYDGEGNAFVAKSNSTSLQIVCLKVIWNCLRICDSSTSGAAQVLPAYVNGHQILKAIIALTARFCELTGSSLKLNDEMLKATNYSNQDENCSSRTATAISATVIKEGW